MLTRTVNGMTYHLHTNRQPRPLYAFDELPGVAKSEFDYAMADADYSRRFFNYRGAWYDVHEFGSGVPFVPNGYRFRHQGVGFRRYQTDSYFSATVISFWDNDGNDLEERKSSWAGFTGNFPIPSQSKHLTGSRSPTG